MKIDEMDASPYLKGNPVSRLVRDVEVSLARARLSKAEYYEQQRKLRDPKYKKRYQK